MRGVMGTRQYFVAMIKLAVIPRLFQFRDWSELPPEHRAQRVLQKSRVPEITSYILDNPDDYIFSALTASFPGEARFTPSHSKHPNIGELEIPLSDELILNDGQHRRAAIEEALRQNPGLGEHSIAVVLFPCEDLDRMQQMFSDLNRTARSTAKSLNILFNHRDLLAQITMAVIESVDVFRDSVDKDRASLPQRSPKLFTLAAIHDATSALVGVVSQDNQQEKQNVAIDFWRTVAASILQWQRVRDGDMKAMEVRAEYIHSHSVALWALGSMGHALMVQFPHDWKSKLSKLREIDWRRTNKEWQRLAMMGVQVINRRQNRDDTAIFLKQKLGLPLTPSEERSLRAVADPDSTLSELASFATP